jgi:DNA-binding transcriptional LysR family regulator
MNMDQIKTFLEVATTGNFNLAAENLNVTQSTVSARVRVLEELLGRPLFVRNHTGAQLTPAGQRFRRYALNMQRLWQRAEQEVALPKEFSASIGLGSQVSLWERLILRWIPRMRLAAPDIAIHLEADYSPSLMRQLGDGVLDIGVMYSPRQTMGLVIEELLVEQLILVSTEPSPGTGSWQENYVFVDWGPDFRDTHDEAFPDLSPALSVGLGPLGLGYVLRHGGSGYFPVRVVRRLLQEEKLFPVPDTPMMQRPAYVVYGASSLDPELLQLGLRELRQIAEESEEELAEVIENFD